jgi:hypothetical protein
VRLESNVPVGHRKRDAPERRVPDVCDIAPEEFVEYLRWKEAATARAAEPIPMARRTRALVTAAMAPALSDVPAEP